MKKVVVLLHFRESNELHMDTTIIGVFRNKASAKAARDRLKDDPRFTLGPEESGSFVIDKYVLDELPGYRLQPIKS